MIDRALAELAREASSLASWRKSALELVRGAVAFDAALFHELSPRVPLERGALIGIDPWLATSGDRSDWDENAVLFGRLRDLALEQRGVAIDHEAFAARSVPLREWERRVRRPLRIASAMLAHLVVRSRIVSVIVLGRKRARFTVRDREAMTELVPALSVCDALVQSVEAGAIRGPSARLECVDQRLTDRQRELVVLVALGHTNRAIGGALGISENTVRNALVDVRQRLGAANRAEIVRLAVLR